MANNLREVTEAAEAMAARKRRLQAAQRENQRKEQVAQALSNWVTAPHGSYPAIEAQVDINAAHKEAEADFFKGLGLLDPDSLDDSQMIYIPIDKARAMARQYANDRMYEAAEKHRLTSLRRECLDMANAEYQVLMSRQIKALNEIGADNVNTNVKVAAAIAKKVK